MLRVQSRPNDIFVTRRKPPIVYFNRVKKLLGDGLGKVAVHGAGACVNTAIFVVQDLVCGLPAELEVACVETYSVPVVLETETGVQSSMKNGIRLVVAKRK
ncbi:MAG: hypothetical protein KVP17_005327 [Porospora cf. gigantea B]|uniref:uncharacterized protein n=1 Tax=Porospora cf. gigantea B TaxID=2853592 RepID=UPI003571E030|nr:MAG: hypothetical protein KVP17_005327 [Porospora cf. gigantea B]